MEIPEKCPPGFIAFYGRPPDGRGRAEFIISKGGLLGHCKSHHARQKALEGFLVREVANNPAGIWRGLDRDGTTSIFAYAGRPPITFLGDTTVEIPRLTGKTFVFYVSRHVNAAGQRRVLYWEWVDEDESIPGFPFDHQVRYDERLWPPPEMNTPNS